MKNYTFIDILNDGRGRTLIDSIEEAEDEIRGRGSTRTTITSFG